MVSRYNRVMHDPTSPLVSEGEVDNSLVDWFLSLTPEQRLAELESRIAFFLSLRTDDESQLSRDPRASQQTPG